MDSSTLFILARKSSSCEVSASMVSWGRKQEGDDGSLAHKAEVDLSTPWREIILRFLSLSLPFHTQQSRLNPLQPLLETNSPTSHSKAFNDSP